MLIDHQLPRDIRDIKLQIAELITQELEGVVRRAGEGLSLEEGGSHNRAISAGEARYPSRWSSPPRIQG
jgi:hypothetical protein